MNSNQMMWNSFASTDIECKLYILKFTNGNCTMPKLNVPGNRTTPRLFYTGKYAIYCANIAHKYVLTNITRNIKVSIGPAHVKIPTDFSNKSM